MITIVELDTKYEISEHVRLMCLKIGCDWHKYRNNAIIQTETSYEYCKRCGRKRIRQKEGSNQLIDSGFLGMEIGIYT